jgi:hypothetical protein
MKKLLIILLFFACESESINPAINYNGKWIDSESNKFTITGDDVILNEVYIGYITKHNESSLNFVVEHKWSNWFYEIDISDSTWMNAYRYKSTDPDSLDIHDNWYVKVRKL